MTIEEKAKAYDLALEKAEKELNACGSQDCDAARQIYRFFPELIKESDDKLVRKAIIDFFESQDENTTYSFIPRKVILDWLEKQDNQTSVDKVELKESERIRKELIMFVRHKGHMPPNHRLTDDEAEKCIAWLEKQCQVKSLTSNDDKSFIEDIKGVIDDAPLVLQSDKDKMIAWLEKQCQVKEIGNSLTREEDEKAKRMLNIITYKMSQHQPDIFTEEENEWFDAWLEKQNVNL